MRRWAQGLAIVATWLLGTACIPEQAGYSEVREVTAARLGRSITSENSPRNGEATLRLLRQPLTADAAVQVALYNNRALLAAFEQLGIARGQWIQARRLPNPELGAALRYGGARPELDLDASLSLTELLFIPWRDGVARASFDATKIEVAETALDIAFATRRSFFDYQAATQQLELGKTILQSLRASVEMVENLHQAGNVTDLNRASERALYEEARIAYARVEANQLAARERLNALMGLWGRPGAHWAAGTKLDDPGEVDSVLSDLERRVIENSLDLELSRRRYQAAARRANLTRLQGWVPGLAAGVSAERDEAWRAGPMVEIEVPLFYQGQGETAVALAEMRRERQLFADTATKIRASARAAASRLSTAASGVEYYESTVLPLRQEVVEQTQLEYNAMSVGVFQLLQAKRDQIAAAQTYVDLIHEYWTERTKVEQLLAGRLPSDAREEPSAAVPLVGAASARPGH